MLAGACSLVDRMYVTAKPGVTTLVMAEIHIKQTAVGCSIRHNVVMSRRLTPNTTQPLFPSTIGTQSQTGSRCLAIIRRWPSPPVSHRQEITVQVFSIRSGAAKPTVVRTRSRCLDKAVLAQGGGRVHRSDEWYW